MILDVTHIALALCITLIPYNVSFNDSHIASPFILEVNNAEEDLLKPAMQGTVGLLQSALSSPSVKSVVVTSSFASVFDPKKGWRSGYTYTAVNMPSHCESSSLINELSGRLEPRHFRRGYFFNTAC